MSTISELLQFAKDNQAPLVIYDSQLDESFVFLKLDKFKEIKQNKSDQSNNNLDQISKKDILNRINKDISLWRKKQELENKEKSVQAMKNQIKNESESEPGQEKLEELSATNSRPQPQTEEFEDDFESGGLEAVDQLQQAKNLTKIAEAESEQEHASEAEISEPKYEQELRNQNTDNIQKDIPKRGEMDTDEMEVENLEREPEVDENLDSSAISYEELDDDLK